MQLMRSVPEFAGVNNGGGSSDSWLKRHLARVRQRELNGERASVANPGTPCRHRSTVQLDDFLRDRKPESEPTMAGVCVCVCLGERVENRGKRVRRDSH